MRQNSGLILLLFRIYINSCCFCHVWHLPYLHVFAYHASQVCFLSFWMYLSFSPVHRIPASFLCSTGLVVVKPFGLYLSWKVISCKDSLVWKMFPNIRRSFPKYKLIVFGTLIFLTSWLHYYFLLWIWRFLKTYYLFDSRIYKMKSSWWKWHSSLIVMMEDLSLILNSFPCLKFLQPVNIRC